MIAELLPHAMPEIVHTRWPRVGVAPGRVGSAEFVATARTASRDLPADVAGALAAFVAGASQAGAVLVRGVPVHGDAGLPLTPCSPTDPIDKDHVSETSLLTVACLLGEPVGYEPEHGGDLVQNIVPTPTAADRQVSTSSRVGLMFHTEAAFHPHRPRYLLLLCLRGDPAAATLLASIGEVLPLLPPQVAATLFEPRFRTAVDESYLGGRRNAFGPPVPVLTGARKRPSMVFDADLMVGTDAAADAALEQLAAAVARHHTAVVLEPGDLLVVDNSVAVHGRSAFTPRFDGTDRWLQRSFVVDDLAPSAGERRGRVITTRFGA